MGRPVGEQILLLGSVRLSPSYVVMPAKSENIYCNFEQGREGKLIPQKPSLSG